MKPKLSAIAAALSVPSGPVSLPPSMLPSRTTSRNPEQQREAYAAAQLKRERKQMRNLAAMNKSGKDLL